MIIFSHKKIYILIDLIWDNNKLYYSSCATGDKQYPRHATLRYPSTNVSM